MIDAMVQRIWARQPDFSGGFHVPARSFVVIGRGLIFQSWGSGICGVSSSGVSRSVVSNSVVFQADPSESICCACTHLAIEVDFHRVDFAVDMS